MGKQNFNDGNVSNITGEAMNGNEEYTYARCRMVNKKIGSKVMSTRIQVNNDRTVRIVRGEEVRNNGTMIVACERYARKNTKFFKAIEKNEMGM